MTQSASETESPVIPSPTPKATRPRTNRDWWPNQLDLQVLQRVRDRGDLDQPALRQKPCHLRRPAQSADRVELPAHHQDLRRDARQLVLDRVLQLVAEGLEQTAVAAFAVVAPGDRRERIRIVRRAARSAMIWQPNELPSSATRPSPAAMIHAASVSAKAGTSSACSGFSLSPKPGRSGT